MTNRLTWKPWNPVTLLSRCGRCTKHNNLQYMMSTSGTSGQEKVAIFWFQWQIWANLISNLFYYTSKTYQTIQPNNNNQRQYCDGITPTAEPVTMLLHYYASNLYLWVRTNPSNTHPWVHLARLWCNVLTKICPQTDRQTCKHLVNYSELLPWRFQLQ